MCEGGRGEGFVDVDGDVDVNVGGSFRCHECDNVVFLMRIHARVYT